MVVTVHAAQFHVLAVDLEDFADNLHLLHPEMVVKLFVVLAILHAKQLQGEGIEPRLLGSPQTRWRIVVIGKFYGNGIASRQFGNMMVGYIPMVGIDVDAIQLWTSHLQLNQQVLCVFFACIAYSNLSIDCKLRIVCIRHSRHLIVGYMYQRPYPQLYAAEDTAQPPIVLIFEIRTVAPTIDLHREFVLACPHEFCHIKLRRRHRVLAIAHLLAVHPDVHRRMHTAEMQNEILRKHLLGDIDECHILSHGIAVLVGSPVLRRLGSHARTILHKRVVDININRCAVALRLPVAGHRDLPPLTHVIVLAIEVHDSFLRIPAPMELPFSVETHNLLTLLFLRRQLQCRVIRQLVDTQYCRVLPVVIFLCLRLQSQHRG